jgi:hypothetical protein
MTRPYLYRGSATAILLNQHHRTGKGLYNLNLGVNPRHHRRNLPLPLPRNNRSQLLLFPTMELQLCPTMVAENYSSSSNHNRVNQRPIMCSNDKHIPLLAPVTMSMEMLSSNSNSHDDHDHDKQKAVVQAI